MFLLLNRDVPRAGTFVTAEMIEQRFAAARAFVDHLGQQVPAAKFRLAPQRLRRHRVVPVRKAASPPRGARVKAVKLRIQGGYAVEQAEYEADPDAPAREAAEIRQRARGLIAGGRAEAHRRVLDLVPSWTRDNYPQKQINLQAHATALMRKETKGSLSAAEQTFADTADALWGEIKKIRAAENRLADAIDQAARGPDSLAALAAIEPADAVHWPPAWTWPDTVPEA